MAGIEHLRAYEREILSRYGQCCWQIGECESFTFGNCSSQVSNEAWKVPGCVASRPAVFSTSSLEGSFPILLSLKQQGSLGIRIGTEYHTADIREDWELQICRFVVHVLVTWLLIFWRAGPRGCLMQLMVTT